jgi:hypothetical protein
MKSNIPISTVKILLSKLSNDLRKGTVLVGGQALALWASHYENKKEFDEKSLVLSHDIDFLGNYSDLDKLASTWNATSVHKNTAFDPSTNMGTFLFNDPEGQSRIVDVLSVVHGIGNKDMEKFTDKIILSVDGKQTSINLLSPPLCLLSRVKNLELYQKQGRQNKVDREQIVRIPLAKELTKKYISDYLNSDKKREALNIAKFLGEHLLADAIPGEHPAWPKKFKEIQFPRLLGQQNEKLARKADKNYQKNEVREAQSGVRYKGKILSIKDNVAIQEYGKSLIAHDLSKINHEIKLDKNYAIYYGETKCIVQEQKTKKLGIKLGGPTDSMMDLFSKNKKEKCQKVKELMEKTVQVETLTEHEEQKKNESDKPRPKGPRP